MKEKWALISVSDKRRLVALARELTDELGYRIISTGGTAHVLREGGIDVLEVSDYTGFPEMMGGRVKTLHPKVHGGLLCRRDVDSDREEAGVHGIGLIDLVVVNLYPFEETVLRSGVSENEAIEQIDIGGVALLRSAAKNARDVTVVCDVAEYQKVLDSLRSGEDLTAMRRRLAVEAFRRTSAYDAAISRYLGSGSPKRGDGEPEGLQPLTVSLAGGRHLRYGENPHQSGEIYGRFAEAFQQLQGKELGYNNILDISAAFELIREFDRPTVAVVKHGNPCGVASAEGLLSAWEGAYATDRKAPFGGIIAVNRKIESDLAQEISRVWCEIIVAPEFSGEARRYFSKKRNLRLIVADPMEKRQRDEGYVMRSVVGGVLRQDADLIEDEPSGFRVVTRRSPGEEEWKSLRFGWAVAKHVKSNAIVLASGERTIGIGAGQMSRVDSSEIAVWKAGQAGLSVEGAIMASDGLIPFTDALLVAADAGIAAAIQPGGSVRDEEIIGTADDRDLAMVFTGTRHFRH